MAPTGLSSQPGNRGGLSLRWRLILAFVSVVLLAHLIFGVASGAMFVTRLLEVVGVQLKARAEEKSVLLGQRLAQPITSLEVLAQSPTLIDAISVANRRYQGDQGAIQASLAERDAEWEAAADSSELVRSRVSESASSERLRVYRQLSPDNVELIVADAFGGLVAATDRTSDYNQSDERWWQVARSGQLFIGQPSLDESTGVDAMIMAVPVRATPDGAVIGVLRTTYRFDAIVARVTALRIGTTGRAALVLADDRIVGEEGATGSLDTQRRELFASAAAAPFVRAELNGRPRILTVVPVVSTPAIAALGWRLVLYHDEAETTAPLAAVRSAQLAAAVVSLLAAGLLAYLIAARISSPLSGLAAAARRLADGDLASRVNLRRNDEIGRLAVSFDAMAAALEQRISSEEAAQAERLRLQDEVIRLQRATLRELATPLIPLRDDLLLLPVVGTVDQERAQQMFEALLQGVAARRARRVVIDLTGTPNLSVEAAETLLRAARGVRLIGAEVILTGVGARLAATLAGLDLDAVVVRPGLEEALREHSLAAASGRYSAEQIG